MAFKTSSMVKALLLASAFAVTILFVMESLSLGEMMERSFWRDEIVLEIPQWTTVHPIEEQAAEGSDLVEGSNDDGHEPRILLVFTGPSESKQNREKALKKLPLYEKNTDYFLEYGMDHCDRHDTLFVVGRDYYGDYKEKIDELRSRCSKRVMLITRRNVCYDMETVRMVFQDGGVNGVSIDDYDYFVYMNCGVTGPHPSIRSTWLEKLLGSLHSDVHMSGLSLNCKGPAHIQSMLFALTRTGVEVVRHLPFDCIEIEKETGKEVPILDIVYQYEVPMGIELLKAGYGLAQPFIGQLRNPMLPEVIFAHNRSNCTFDYLWVGGNLELYSNFTLPTFGDVGFWKTSAHFLPEIVDLLNYTDPITW